ncbi:MAG: hypothetical protein ACYDHF_06200 [Candidatus Cryosericum sp.]
MFSHNELITEADKIHQSNSHNLGDRHFEWLLGHAVLNLSARAKIVIPEWWSDWDSTDPQNPLLLLAVSLNSQRIFAQPDSGSYLGYGEDCGDNVRQKLTDWTGPQKLFSKLEIHAKQSAGEN